MDKCGSLSALFSKYQSNSVRWPDEMEIFIVYMLSEIRSPLKIVAFLGGKRYCVVGRELQNICA